MSELGPCSALGYCSFRGSCHWNLDEGATCTCYKGFQGEDCSQQVREENLIVEEKKMEDIQEKAADIKDDDKYVKKMIDGGNKRKSEEDEQKMPALWNSDSKDAEKKIVYGYETMPGDEKKTAEYEKKKVGIQDNRDAERNIVYGYETISGKNGEDQEKKMNDQGNLDSKVAEKKIVYGDETMAGLGKKSEEPEKKKNRMQDIKDAGKNVAYDDRIMSDADIRKKAMEYEGDGTMSSFSNGRYRSKHVEGWIEPRIKDEQAKEQDGSHPFAAKKSCTRKPPPPNVREKVFKSDQRMRKDKHDMNRKLLPNDWDVTRYDTTRYDATLKDVMGDDQQQKEGTVSGSTGNARMLTLFGSGIFIGILFGLVVFILYKLVLAFQSDRGEEHRSFNNEAYEEEEGEAPEEILIEV